jgi:hypothetical protein
LTSFCLFSSCLPPANPIFSFPFFDPEAIVCGSILFLLSV